MVNSPSRAGTGRHAIWYQHNATRDLPGLEFVIDFNGLLQWELGGFRMDPSIAGHRDDLHQFDAGTPVRNAQGCPVRRAAVMEVVVAAAQADNGPNAATPQ
jgi:hypothetical protein